MCVLNEERNSLRQVLCNITFFSSRSSVYARYQEGLEIDRCGGKHTSKTICLNRIYELYFGFARPYVI